MSNAFLNTFTVDTKILFGYFNGRTYVNPKVLTISSISLSDNGLYKVTFKEPHMEGTYYYHKTQLFNMKTAYDKFEKKN